VPTIKTDNISMIRATKHPPEFCVNKWTEPDAHGTYHLLDSAVYFGMKKAEENLVDTSRHSATMRLDLDRA
jgi:hypothetical protein